MLNFPPPLLRHHIRRPGFIYGPLSYSFLSKLLPPDGGDPQFDDLCVKFTTSCHVGSSSYWISPFCVTSRFPVGSLQICILTLTFLFSSIGFGSLKSYPSPCSLWKYSTLMPTSGFPTIQCIP